MKTYFAYAQKEPYRLFFPLGVLYLLWGTLLWLPQIWIQEDYPVLAHRYLMLNGFSGSFIAGFLMTAVPKFSQTKTASLFEVVGFLFLTLVGLVFSFRGQESLMYFISGAQAFLILLFLVRRVTKRKVNPPYSFVFILVGLLLWIFSAISSGLTLEDAFKNLHYEGALAAIILGVGSRLVPGILGHVEIVQTQRKRYETQKNFFLTVPPYFYALIAAFITSYFLPDFRGAILRLIVVAFIALVYWKLYLKPKDRSALTWCIWFSCWCIVLSFLLKVLWIEGSIHSGHAFFFSGIVLLSFLIGTRVLQSHGPGDKRLENIKTLYIVTFLVTLAAATRVSAILMPEGYLRHLGYSSFVLTLGTFIWSWRYLRFITIHK